jgi:hypothetical protein
MFRLTRECRGAAVSRRFADRLDPHYLGAAPMAHTPKYRKQTGNLNDNGTRTPSRGYADFPFIKPDGTKGYKRVYFPGQHDSTESREAYHRALAEWEAQGRKAPVNPATAASGATGPSIAEVLRDYWRHVQTEHVNSPSAQEHVRQAVRPLTRSSASRAAWVWRRP